MFLDFLLDDSNRTCFFYLSDMAHYTGFKVCSASLKLVLWKQGMKMQNMLQSIPTSISRWIQFIQRTLGSGQGYTLDLHMGAV